jgi:hypothetical protein
VLISSGGLGSLPQRANAALVVGRGRSTPRRPWGGGQVVAQKIELNSVDIRPERTDDTELVIVTVTVADADQPANKRRQPSMTEYLDYIGIRSAIDRHAGRGRRRRGGTSS